MVEVQILRWMGVFSLVGFPWLYNIPSLADVTMEIKACTLLRVKTTKDSDVTMESRACSLL
jgi:hypothetical protein